MPSVTARRGVFLLPLSLALCGDSFNMSGGCGGAAKDTSVTVQLACTLEASGALSEPMTCGGTWSRDPRYGPRSSIDLFALATSDWAARRVPPVVQIWFDVASPFQAGETYGPDLAAPFTASTTVQVATREAAGYRGQGGPGVAPPAEGLIRYAITSLAPLAGTFEMTLVPGATKSWPLQLPEWSAPAGPAGTSITLRGTFQER